MLLIQVFVVLQENKMFNIDDACVTNGIVDDSESDDNKFGKQNLSDSKSDYEIGFQFRANLIKTSFSIKIGLFFNSNQFEYN